jgi:hypothetical protein
LSVAAPTTDPGGGVPTTFVFVTSTQSILAGTLMVQPAAAGKFGSVGVSVTV